MINIVGRTMFANLTSALVITHLRTEQEFFSDTKRNSIKLIKSGFDIIVMRSKNHDADAGSGSNNRIPCHMIYLLL